MDTESLKSGFSEVSNRSRRTPIPVGSMTGTCLSSPNSLILQTSHNGYPVNGIIPNGMHLATMGMGNGSIKSGGYPSHNNLGTPTSLMGNGGGLYGHTGMIMTTPLGGTPTPPMSTGQQTNGYGGGGYTNGNVTPNSGARQQQHQQPQQQQRSSSGGGSMHHSGSSGSSHHRSHRSGRSSRNNREEPLLETPESGHGSDEIEAMDQMSPSTHLAHEVSNGRNGGIRSGGHDAIEVQIMPQDDGWADTATAVTGNTSDRSNSPVGNNGTAASIKWAQIPSSDESALRLSWCQRYGGSLLGAGIVVLAAASPVLMVVGHRVGLPSSRPIINVRECGPECHAFLISLVVKLIVLFGAIWGVFWRSPSATMPRVYLFRAITLLLAFLAAFTFWLFYWVRAEGDGDLSLVAAVTFASGLVDALLAIHYLGVLLTEIRHVSPQFQITAVRSPDGISKQWTIGSLSIQRAAVWILQHYYAEFPAYNPHLERMPTLQRKRHASITNASNASSFKFYDFDGVPSSFSTGGRLSRRGLSHNERFYEEHEFERRVRKRKARLVTAAEEAFQHIKRLQDEQGTTTQLDAMEAAAAVFPSLARPLQKYLRATRQQPWHTAEGVLNHLSTCLRLGLAPRAFLDKYLSYQPVLQGTRDNEASWALVSDVSVSRQIGKDVTFLLRSGEISLYVTVAPLPHINLTEQVVDPKSNKFTLRLNSETSV